MTGQNLVHLTVDMTARASYGKLLAYLSSRSQDIEACEDALSEAFAKALVRWEVDGVPENPEAWLFRVAKNHLIDGGRKRKTSNDAVETLLLMDLEKADDNQAPGTAFKDDRLKLMFACCHPSIDESVRTPLMLQTVLGLDSNVIASAFLTSPAAMMKKLVRAKQKIKIAGIGFEVPSPEALFDRVEYVAEAIFAIYGKSWDAFGSFDSKLQDLDREAVYLAQVLVELLPNEPEPKGLLAFIYHCESRKAARRDRENAYIPLDEQDTGTWDLDLISRAESLLRAAFSISKIGRFQIEGAIQSAHSARIFQKANNWREIVTLYDGLISLAPTVGAYVSRASAIAESSGFEVGLESLERIPSAFIASYQPYWALKAELLKRANRYDESQSAYDMAIGLSHDESVRGFLRKKREALPER